MPSETPARYQEWLEFFFGRYERDSDNAWSMDWAFGASPPEMAELFIWTLEHSGAELARYSDAQVSTGLQALLFSNFSDVAYVLASSNVPEPLRLNMLRSFRPLYRDCLAQRAPPVLGHLSETRDNPLEFVTYMLWDVAPFDVMALKSKERTDVLLNVFWDVLHLPNEACVESVLHGLGHLGEPARPRAREMIGRWIDERPKVRPELLRYAAAPQTGCIL